ncbi:unnamed protein product [Haemonchus placei]|uniref:Uncharacterized protein n=1 Tax=Haemonchus placei TaxID=6290 RepID=A0A3P7WAY7_HAEPC|nr:unnamed protein product [Haemonchus placei]
MKNEMEQRGLFDFSLKHTDEPYSSDSSLSKGCYSDDDDAATQGKWAFRRCPNCMNDGEYECKKYDVGFAIQAAQQEALVYAEHCEKSYEKAQERKKRKYGLSKTKPADHKSAYCMDDNPKLSPSVQREGNARQPTSCQRCAKHIKELSLSEARLEFIVTWGQNIRKATRKQDKAYAKIDELVAVLLQLTRPLRALLGGQLGRLTKILLRIGDAYTLPNYEPRWSLKRSRYSSDDSNDVQ